ncbi:MAG TPA: EAL domain-containing protein [Longimicrobiales bacterium]|nr:EAL domain-containing protein [Longimicrobiales bacterium]
MHVLQTLLNDHDLRMVLLAVAICVFGTAATINVSSRVGTTRRTLWLTLVSLCAGATVWSTHFIAMLAYKAGMSMAYDPLLTFLSFAAGTVVMGIGFDVAIRRAGDLRAGLLGGAILGLGVIILHYVGMAALRLPHQLTFAPGLVVLSVVFSLGFGSLALSTAFGKPSPYARTAGVTLMILMIATLHFTAMGAVHLGHTMTGVDFAAGVSRSGLATAVAIASSSVLIIGLIGAIVDRKVSLRFAAEAERFRTLANGAFEAIVVHRGGVVVDANAVAQQMFGLDDVAQLQLVQSWFVESSEWRGHEHLGEDQATEVTLKRANGTTFPAEICSRTINLSDGSIGELLAIRDLTTRKESEARIAHLALHDPLTDLPNRRFFMEMAMKTMSLAVRTDEKFALFAIDVDNFKIVNDMHGHAAGDELLRIIGQRISATVRDADVAARFGGDEFAILLTCASGTNNTVAFAERLQDALRAPIVIHGVELTVTTSIGVALFPDDGRTIELVLRSADTAMYRAKADGKATLRFFESQMDAAMIARRQIEHGLRQAVAENRLTVAYQPIVDSVTRTPLAFEALARWTDPELGVVPPTDFIPVAEETGLIVPIGEFILRQACMDAVKWPAQLRVAVNLSAVQFRRKGIVETVQRALQDSGLPGERLELEVTETLLVENRDDALQILTQLKQLGVAISMDDFGTGYSSLSYLQSFPFDKIKIDRAFVSDLPSNWQNASIVRAVAAMGRSLAMRVVAEGVETNNQADMLQGFECDELQGFLIARPMDVSEINAFLATREELLVVA